MQVIWPEPVAAVVQGRMGPGGIGGVRGARARWEDYSTAMEWSTSGEERPAWHSGVERVLPAGGEVYEVLKLDVQET